MSAKTKKKRVGFDLDGVIIGKPFFVPEFVMEKLVRKKGRRLAYRYPESKTERAIRKISHIPVFRPPIRKNVSVIRKLHKSSKYQLFVVSSRYSFLEKRTEQWFKYHKLKKFFKDIYINLADEQPHLYKEKMVKTLKLDVFIDDDLRLLKYLRRKIKNVDFLYVKDYKKNNNMPK